MKCICGQAVAGRDELVDHAADAHDAFDVVMEIYAEGVDDE